MPHTPSNEGVARLSGEKCHRRHARTCLGVTWEVSEGSHTIASQLDRQGNRGCGVGCETEAKPHLWVNRSRIAYQDVRDRDEERRYDRGLGKCSEKFRKHPHVNRVRKVLENPGHTPAVEKSGSCWRLCREAGVEAAGICWSWGWCSWSRPEGSGLCWRTKQCSRLCWHCSCAGTVARRYCSSLV